MANLRAPSGEAGEKQHTQSRGRASLIAGRPPRLNGIRDRARSGPGAFATSPTTNIHGRSAKPGDLRRPFGAVPITAKLLISASLLDVFKSHRLAFSLTRFASIRDRRRGTRKPGISRKKRSVPDKEVGPLYCPLFASSTARASMTGGGSISPAEVATCAASPVLARFSAFPCYNLVEQRVDRSSMLGAKLSFPRAGLGWGSMPRGAIEADLASGELVQLQLEDAQADEYTMPMSIALRRSRLGRPTSGGNGRVGGPPTRLATHGSAAKRPAVEPA
jgi:hypothetical protein